MVDLADVAHWFGGDLALTSTGDLARVTRDDRSRQRVLRRIMTAEGDYISHPDYGSGLPQRIGANLNLAETKAVIQGQMRKEASVDQADPPTVEVAAIQNGVLANIAYTIAPEGQRTNFSFDAGPPDGA